MTLNTTPQSTAGTAGGSPRPVPFDPEIVSAVEAAAEAGPPMTRESLAGMRSGADMMTVSTADAVGDREIDHSDHVIPGPAGAPDIEITVLRPRGVTGPLPCLYNMHGGGMIMGHRSWETGRLVDLVETHGVVAVNVEYRLAPENPYPAGVEDCYAGLVYTASHAEELGIDPDRIIVMGGSAGGYLAAAMSLLARDRGGPAIAGQLLLCPMIDNTNTSVSSHQYSGLGTWNREANEFAWSCVLGDDLAFSDEAPGYAAPIHEHDLSNLPPAFIEAGSAETFRDEDVEYATRIWAVGGQAELHVWSGGCHGFDIYAPDSEISRAALASRDSWVRRILDRKER